MVEYIIRQKIYDSMYWKAECFGLTAELLVDKGTALRYVRRHAQWASGTPSQLQHGVAFAVSCTHALPPQAGGMYGEPQRPSEFLCLILKMLQIQPDKDIIVEFIKDDGFKYLRLLGEWGRARMLQSRILPIRRVL